MDARTQRQYSSSNHTYYELQTSSRRPRMSIYVTHTSPPSTRAGTRRDSKLATRAFPFDDSTNILRHRSRDVNRTSHTLHTPSTTTTTPSASLAPPRVAPRDVSVDPIVGLGGPWRPSRRVTTLERPPTDGCRFSRQNQRKGACPDDFDDRRRSSSTHLRAGSVVARHSSTRRDPGTRRRRGLEVFLCVFRATCPRARVDPPRDVDATSTSSRTETRPRG